MKMRLCRVSNSNAIRQFSLRQPKNRARESAGKRQESGRKNHGFSDAAMAKFRVMAAISHDKVADNLRYRKSVIIAY
ncbi:hypothetical protein [Noviherbaspirillum sedimenti]|uniref:hypothetical protein n=1 Tax=Noviherbaspirillum sedimenti TaxID=2320865 RepID=UPI0011C4A36F|nr:hypothetical protein [Noviherbaspirillum sedimenti]